MFYFSLWLVNAYICELSFFFADHSTTCYFDIAFFNGVNGLLAVVGLHSYFAVYFFVNSSG